MDGEGKIDETRAECVRGFMNDTKELMKATRKKCEKNEGCWTQEVSKNEKY